MVFLKCTLEKGPEGFQHSYLVALHVAQFSSYTQVSVNDTRTKHDSHADTTAVGSSTALVHHDYKQPVHVHVYTTDVAQ